MPGAPTMAAKRFRNPTEAGRLLAETDPVGF
jgi:hypothetical protein